MTDPSEIQTEIKKLEKRLEALAPKGRPDPAHESEYHRTKTELDKLRAQLKSLESGRRVSESPRPEPESAFRRLLKEAERLAEEAQFAEALKALEEAELYVGEWEERRALVAQVRRRVEQARRGGKKNHMEHTQISEYSRLLEEAERLKREARFTDALAELEEAEQYVGEHGDRRAQVDEARRLVELARENWKEDQAKRIKDALADEAQPLPADIAVWIEEFQAQAPDQKAQAEEWLKQVSDRRRLDAALQAKDALLQELKPLWGECQRALAATPQETVAAMEAAKKALERVREVQREYPEARPILDVVTEAEAWDIRARGPLATALHEAKFEALLQQYEYLKKRGHTELPRFQAVREAGRLRVIKDGETGQETLDVQRDWELVSAENAIAEIENTAVEWACHKAKEKLEEAQSQAMPRDPRRAEALLKEARGLFVPPRKQGDAAWQARLREIDTYDRIAVQPALKRLHEAERRRDAALTNPDVLKAWDELGEVERLELYVSGLALARASLHERLNFLIEEALKKAEGLRRLRRWKEAQQVVEPFLDRTRQDERLKEITDKLEAFIAGCEEGARDEQFTLKSLGEIQDLVGRGTAEAVRDAHERLAALETSLGENAAAYPRIRELRNRIDARLEPQNLLDQAALIHDTAIADEEFEAILGALKEAEQTSAVLVNERRLRARLVFRQAEREWEYGTPSFAELRVRYQAVIDAQGADAEQARSRLAQIAQSERERSQFEPKLATARDHLDQGRYRQAYDLLRSLVERETPIPQNKQAWELFGEAREKLLHQIDDELSGLQQDGRELNTGAILAKWKELEALDPQQARKWNELAARCHIQMAQDHGAQKHWAMAKEHWQQARTLIPRGSQWAPTIETGLREADKRDVFARVDALRASPEQALPLLERLVSQWDDPESRVRLASVYLQIGNLQMAQIQIEHAERSVATGDTEIPPHLDGEIGRVREQLTEEKKLRHDWERLAQRLRPENPLEEFRLAAEQFRRLRKKYRQRRETLDEWWQELIDEVVEELEATWEQSQQQGAPLWRAAWPMLKILELRSHHGQARETLREVAQKSIDLGRKVAALSHSTDGPPGVPADQSLTRQIREIEELREEARAYQEIFRRRGGELRSVSSTATELDAHVSAIHRWWEKLTELDRCLQEGWHTLRSAMRTGSQTDWEAVDEVKVKVIGTFDRSTLETSRHIYSDEAGTFARHPTVALFVRECEEAKNMRTKLEGYLQELPQAWRDEDFDRVCWLIAEIRKADPPDDPRFYLYATAQIEIRREQQIQLGELEELARQRKEQVSVLTNWANAARQQVVPWRPFMPRIENAVGQTAEAQVVIAEKLRAIREAVQSGDLVGAGRHYASLPAQSLPAIEHEDKPSAPPAVIEALEASVNEAKFKDALQLCLDALCGDGLPSAISALLDTEWPDLPRVVEQWSAEANNVKGGMVTRPEYRSRWSLLKAQEWLQELPAKSHPDKDESVQSQRACLALARGMALADEVKSWVQEAQDQLQAILDIRQAFLDHLQNARQSMEAGRPRWFYKVLWWKEKERQDYLDSAEEELNQAAERCYASEDLRAVYDLLRRLR